MASSKHWYGDGTFKTVPHLFYQFYTLHGIQVKNSIPLLYALLPDKTEATYVRLLQQVKQLQPDVYPETFMTDFESAIVSAIRQEFPTAKNRGCFFHFTQCIFRRIQAEGLQRRYETDVDFAMKMRLLSALAFITTEDVVEAFEVLSGDNMPEEAQGIIDYFEDCWIGRPQRRKGRREPRFSLEMWNCHEGVRQRLPKTNNSIEGWHRGFEMQISAQHPNIWKFIEAIQREQSIRTLQIEQYVSGQQGTLSRKKYRDCAERLFRVVANYQKNNVLEFLRGVAHNINY